jgi:hypothetical protein
LMTFGSTIIIKWIMILPWTLHFLSFGICKIKSGKLFLISKSGNLSASIHLSFKISSPINNLIQQKNFWKSRKTQTDFTWIQQTFFNQTYCWQQECSLDLDYCFLCCSSTKYPFFSGNFHFGGT